MYIYIQTNNYIYKYMYIYNYIYINFLYIYTLVCIFFGTQIFSIFHVFWVCTTLYQHQEKSWFQTGLLDTHVTHFTDHCVARKNCVRIFSL